jgi:hypothetical protein
VLTQRTAQKQRPAPADPQSLERTVRQLLADKVSGNLVGFWLLIPEHLRLGTCNLRTGRTLSQKGFELANGLPFVAADPALHELFDAHTVAQAQALQVALGKLRRAGRPTQLK